MMTCWAAYSKNDYIRNKSSSGGVFYEIAKRMLENQGVVYGVAMSDGNKTSEYVRITHLDELSPVLGSKYLQAKIGDTFSNVERDLISGISVLFSGTGCIINGLKLFLNHNYENLLCVDVICHGVSSPLLWDKYIRNIERKAKSRINHVEFRNKKNGWENFCVSWTDEQDRQTTTPLYASSYMQWFLNNLSLRPSCYVCKSKTERSADISLGDFWGIDRVAPDMNDGKGTSLVITRTNLGKQVFDSIIPRLCVKEASYKEAVRENAMENESPSKPKKRDKFFCDLQNMSISQLERKYKTSGFIYQIRKCMSKYTCNIFFAFKKRDSDYINSSSDLIVTKTPILYMNKSDCCGCTACYSICKNNAISMKVDEEGFEYPYIDTNKCICCNQCIAVCPMKATSE